VSQEECARLREGVPYVKVHRYNPKHLYPKLNGYRDNGQRKVWSSGGSTHCTSADSLIYVTSSSEVLYYGNSAGSLPSVSVQSDREVVQTINTQENIPHV
jgi:hypothetical protein